MKKIMTALLALTCLTGTLTAQFKVGDASGRKAATAKKKADEKSATMARKAGGTAQAANVKAATPTKTASKKAATKKSDEK